MSPVIIYNKALAVKQSVTSTLISPPFSVAFMGFTLRSPPAMPTTLSMDLHCSKGIPIFFTYLIIGIPLFLGVGLIHGLRKMAETVGLAGSVTRGFLFAAVCTLPMLVGYAVVFDLNSEITSTQIFTGAIVAGFIEELFYRGVFFGQIYRYTRIGFIPSILLGALVFAIGHLYQSQDLSTLIGIFITS